MDDAPATSLKPQGSYADEQPSLVTLKHTESGSGHRLAKICFLPAGCHLTTKQVHELFQTQWGLALPNLMVQCDFGTAHPTTLSTAALVKLPQFEEWLEHANKHVQAGA